LEEPEDPGVAIDKFKLQHHTKDNFLVHHQNPFKIIVLLLAFIIELEQRYPEVKSESLLVKERLNKIGVSIIEKFRNVDKLEIMVTEKVYDGCETIDLISQYSMTELLKN
jgi:hypothetical protein